MQETVDREPLLTAGTVVAIIGAVLAVAVSFGFDITDDQQSKLLGLITVLAPFAVALLARPKVTPVASPRNNAGDLLIPVVPYHDQGSTYHDREFGAINLGLIGLVVVVVLATLFVIGLLR